MVGNAKILFCSCHRDVKEPSGLWILSRLELMGIQ